MGVWSNQNAPLLGLDLAGLGARGSA